MISFTVARRTPEIGIRMALGAHGRQLLAMVLLQGMRFEIDRNGKTIVAAEEDSRLRIITQPRPLQRIGAWVARVAAQTARGWSLRLQRRRVPYF